MEKERLEQQLADELSHISKGAPHQNELRAIYNMQRRHDLGRNPNYPCEVSLSSAIAAVRLAHPEFSPVYDSEFFQWPIKHLAIDIYEICHALNESSVPPVHCSCAMVEFAHIGEIVGGTWVGGTVASTTLRASRLVSQYDACLAVGRVDVGALIERFGDLLIFVCRNLPTPKAVTIIQRCAHIGFCEEFCGIDAIFTKQALMSWQCPQSL